MITPNTPPGPSAPLEESISAPAQAAGDLTSKKYVHSSWLAPTKATAAWGALGASGSRSHRSDMMLDFLLTVDFDGDFAGDLRSSSSSSLSSPPMSSVGLMFSVS